jgi:preprotein translocase subunit SecE
MRLEYAVMPGNPDAVDRAVGCLFSYCNGNSMANKFTNFFKDIKLEMAKVSWPNKDELIGSTVIVIVSLAILSVFIGVCDVVLSKIVNIIMTML